MSRTSRSRIRADCPELFQLVGAYLHQDFDLDYPDAGAALQAAIDENKPDRLRAVLNELARHRPDSELGAKSFVNALCDYHPPGDRLSYLQWLDKLESKVSDSFEAD